MRHHVQRERRIVKVAEGGNAIRNYRLLREWTQEIAAEWYGVHVRTWRRWEAGTVPAPQAALNRIRSWVAATLPWAREYVS